MISRMFGTLRLYRTIWLGSIELMRIEMLTSRKFDAAVLIGGMEGIFDEAQLF